MPKRTAVAVSGILAAALLAAACSDSTSPARRALGTPQFDFSPNGITRNQVNGSLGLNGRVLIKGFNPTNPHHGDAIIATFFWFGSTNIIDSVTDVLTDPSFTPVGNKYTLVEYVTSGGISMATYVATSVQNFPDPNDPSTGVVLAVRANLSDSVSEGGIEISSWSGVEAVSAQALGAHQHGFGSGSSPTVADPGAISVGAGALVYGVTMSNGLAGRDPPPGFANVQTQSDAAMVTEGDYAVQATAGTAHPQWTWYFSSPSTWLATVLTLNPAASAATGTLTASTSTTGSGLDPDGYTVTVDGGSPQAIGINASVRYANLSAGSHSVALSGVAANCTVTGGNTQTVSVPAGGTVTASFAVSCSATTTGNLTVSTSTSGSSLDPDGYTVTVDGGSPQAVGINASVSYPNLSAGNHSVAISGVAANCTVSGGNTQTVTVPTGGTVTASFAVSCVTPPGNLTVSTSTTGANLDPNGYTVTVDGVSPQAIGINASVSYTNLSAGTHTVAISGVAANCTVSGGTSRTLSVPSGGTATTTFSVSCNAPPVVNAGPDQTAVTGLLYSFSPSFTDANNDGPWSYRIDWGDGSVSTGTRTSQGSWSVGHTYVIVLPRSFTVRVTVTDSHGASGSDTKVVSVLLL